MNWILPIGRPLAGLVYCIFPMVTSFRWMGVFRLLAVLNIGFIAYLLWVWMRHWKVPGYPAFLIAIMVISLPAFQVFSSYISTIPHGLGVTFALLALLSANAGIEAKQYKKIGFFAGAIFFQIAALSFNQASALFYCSALAVGLLMTDSSKFLKVWPKKLLCFAAVLAGAMVIYYVVFRYSADIFSFRNVGKYDGRNFVKDYAQRWTWFIERPMVETSSLWFITPQFNMQQWSLRAVIYLMVLGAGMASHKIAAIIKYLAVMALFPVAYGISLISSDPSTEYRTYAALGSVFIFAFFVGLYSLEIDRYKEFWRRSLLVTLSMVALMAAVVANSTVTRYFVLCDSTEFRYTKSEIRAYLASGKELKVVHIIHVGATIAAAVQRNEIGEPTNRHTPNVEPFVRAVLSELGYEKPVRITSVGSLEGPWIEMVFNKNNVQPSQVVLPPNTEGSLVINLSRVNFL